MTQTPMIKVPSHRLYLDEAGDHTYRDLDYVSHRYLGLLGCIFQRESDYKTADHELNEIKKKFWPKPDPDRPIIFHREEMVYCKGYFAIFKNQDVRAQFDEELLAFLTRQKFVVINVILDKKSHKGRYKDPINPYQYCLTAMMERYCGWLKFRNVYGDVMAESRGGQEDQQIKKVYSKIFESGTNQRSDPGFFNQVLTSREIKIKPKVANISGLQIADILAYPLKEKLFYTEGIRTNNFLGTFNERIFKAVQRKYNQQFFSRRLRGYGEVFIK